MRFAIGLLAVAVMATGPHLFYTTEPVVLAGAFESGFQAGSLMGPGGRVAPEPAAVSIGIQSPFNYAVIPPGTFLAFDVTGSDFTSVRYAVDGGSAQVLSPPYAVDTSGWAPGTHVVLVEAIDGAVVVASDVFVFFIDADASWPLDTIPVDVVLIGFDLPPELVSSQILRATDVSTALTPAPGSEHTFQLRFDVTVRATDSAYHAAFLAAMSASATYRDDLQARLNLTALLDQRDNGTARDIFDNLVGLEIPASEAERYVEATPPFATSSGAGFTFYLMNLSGLDNPAVGADHWFVRPVLDPDTDRILDWWRLEWDNELNTPMGFPLNAFGGPGHRVYIDPTAYQWYLDWAHIWWEGGDGPAPYGIPYEGVAPVARADYLAGIVNDLIVGLAAWLPWGPPQEPGIEVRSYVLSGSVSHDLGELQWITSDDRLGDYLRRFLPFKQWQLNTTFGNISDLTSLEQVVDQSTTYVGGWGYIDGEAVWNYLYDNRDLYVPNDPDVFEMLTVNLLYDNRSMIYFGQEFTGLGGLGITAIFLKTDRLFYADGTPQKGLTSVISHESGHNLGYGHQFGPNYRADFIDGNMGYFGNELEYGTFWEDALHRLYVREKQLRLLEALDGLGPLDLRPEFQAFREHYQGLDFLAAYEDLQLIEDMLSDTVPPAADAGGDRIVDEDVALALSGAASTDNFRILTYAWNFGDGDQAASGSPDVNKMWSQPGLYAVTLTVYDAAGNSASDTIAVTVRDTVQPTLQVLSPSTEDLLSSDDVVVTWSASDVGLGIARFELNLDGGTAVELGAETTSHTFTGVSDGPHTIGVTAFDGSGNRASSSVEFVVDATPPSLSILSPVAGAILSESTIDISWQASDTTTDITGIEVQLDDQASVALAGTETHRTFTGLAEGTHLATVTAVDQAGHEGSDTLQFSVDLPEADQPPFSVWELVLIGSTVGVAGVTLILVWGLRRRKHRPRA